MDDIEELYCKRLKESKLTDPFCPIPVAQFHQWANKVDLMSLDADEPFFFLEDSVAHAFKKYSYDLINELSKSFECRDLHLGGQLQTIGSCWDGSKTGNVNEVDCLYVMRTEDISIEETWTKGFYQIFTYAGSSKREIKAREVRDRFADAYSRLLHQRHLPPDLYHGGYASPHFSGVRCNGPAVTSQFLLGQGSYLTLDITVAFALPKEVYISNELWQAIAEFVADNCGGPLSSTVTLHLIPDFSKNLWKVSTAYLEAELLRNLSHAAPVKTALSLCKAIVSHLNKWNGEKLPAYISSTSKQSRAILDDLAAYLAMPDSEAKARTEKRLNHKMRYAHIWIPGQEKLQFNEEQRTGISINTAAIKHIILRYALETPDAFSASADTGIAVDLTKKVFQTLGDERCYCSSHAFLEGLDVAHFSVLPILANVKDAIARDVQEQCRVLYSKLCLISQVRGASGILSTVANLGYAILLFKNIFST